MLKKIALFVISFFLYAHLFSQQNPIQINYVDELAKIGNDSNYPLNGYYILQRDLNFDDPNSYFDISLMPYFTRGSWVGICVSNISSFATNYPFTGTFDGNNFIIKNFRISTHDKVYVGFFRATSFATIKNLGLVNVNLASAQSTMGGLVGGLENTNINNCFVTGSIYGGKASYTNFGYQTTSFGGLVGSMFNSRITNCYTNVDIGGVNSVGGLVGTTIGPTTTNYIKNCYTAGRVLLLNSSSYSLIIGLRSGASYFKDSILNTYSAGSFIGKTPSNTNGGLFIGGCYDVNSTIDTLYLKGCFSVNNSLKPIKFDFQNGLTYRAAPGNKVYNLWDTVFTGSTNRNFTPVTTMAYNNTYLYNATNQKYPLLYRSDMPGTLMGGQRAVYPAVIEKTTGSINGYADFVKPVDNFTKTGTPATFNINNINGINNFNDLVYSYFSINSSNGTLSWVEEIPTGEYLVEIRGEKGTENSQSWVRVVINRNNDAITSVNAQSVQFTTKDSTINGDYITIDTLNFVNRNYTIETWAKMENKVGGYRRIFNFGVVGFAPIVLTFPDATHLAFRSNGAFRTINLPAGFNAYSWNHYALTQQDNWAKLYLNGILIDSIAGAKPTVGFNKNYIGRSSSTTDSATTGRFSELRIWLKAQSASQIKALYNQKVPINADSLYVYLPLTNIIYGEYPILSDALGNAAENIYDINPIAYFRRNARASVKYIYDSSQQYVYGTLKSPLANNEILQIALKDSNTWVDVQHISNYLFSYKLPENFISGNIYVRSIINGEPTNRFGNTYNQSKKYVDWVGTGMRINPNIPYKSVTGFGNIYGVNYLIQRNKNKLADTIANPLVGSFTDANQKTGFFAGSIYKAEYSLRTLNSYNLLYSTPYNINDTVITSYYGNNVNFFKFAYNNGNFYIIFKNDAPAGMYVPITGFGRTFQVLNSLGQENVGFDGTNLFNHIPINIIYGDSLKEIRYNSHQYTTTAYKTITTSIPTIIGNDSFTTNLRYSILARRNGVNVPGYSLNNDNFALIGSNRPVGTDSVFVTFQGIFDEIIVDTFLFTYQYSKPQVSYQPNILKSYSLISKQVTSNYPNVVDSGGGTLTYSLLNTINGVTLNTTTGLISVSNWDLLPFDTNKISIRVSNVSYSDTLLFIILKNSFNVLYYSNSSYRTKSTNGADYIQLPPIDLRNKAFGMDIWYKHNAQTGGWHRIFDIGTGGNNQGIIIGFPNATQLFVRTPNQTDSNINIPANVQINQWNHYAVSVNNSGRLYFYINGKLIFNRLAGGTTPQVVFNSNFIGKSNYGASDAPSVGQFTDFRIWDNVIDSNIYNIRGLNNIITNGGANLIYYLPLSLPVYNQNIPLKNVDILKNTAVYSPLILDTVAYIMGNSNSFNFDADRIFLGGETSLTGTNKSIQATIYNYSSEIDTSTQSSYNHISSYIKNNYWGMILSPQQGSNLNNQIVTLTESVTGTTNMYNYVLNVLPDYNTYIPGDSIKIQVGNGGIVYPKNDYIINRQTPYNYQITNVGTLNNLISLDENTGKMTVSNTVPIGLYPIKLNVTNIWGTLNINGLVVVGDSLKSIQYVLDSISVNYGIDSTNLPYTLGTRSNPTYSISAVPNNPNITIHPQNGKIYWNKEVPVGVYILTINASNSLNTIYKTIKLNIQGLSPRNFSYSSKINNYISSGFDTSYVNLRVQSLDYGGFPLVFSADLPPGFRFEGDSGKIVARLDSMVAGNYTVIVTASNTSNILPNYILDTLYINVLKTSQDTILGFKNAYMTFTTNNLNGSGDYLNLPSINLSKNFTVEAWVKLNDITRDYQRIFDAGSGYNSIFTIATQASGKLFLFLPSDSIGTAKIEVPDSRIRIVNNTWFHIALVKNGKNAKLYFNGLKAIDTNFTNSLSYIDNLPNVGFFRSNYPPDNSTLGQLDELRIWKKALSPNEIERYRLFNILPNIDSLYFYLPLNKSLYLDSSVSNSAIIKNQATGKHAWQINATAIGNGLKIRRDSTRQILYGTIDNTTTNPLNKTIVVRTQFATLPMAADSVRNAVSIGYLWAADYGAIDRKFRTGNFVVTKNAGAITFKPSKYFVKYAPYNLLYDASNSITITKKTAVYYSNKPTILQNIESSTLGYTIPDGFAGITINPVTGVLRIHVDSALNFNGKYILLPVTASNYSGQTTAIVSIFIITANIIGFNNTSVSLPNNNGADYIKLPNLDLRNTNFAVETWFKLSGSPISFKRIFNLNPLTFLFYFSSNKLELSVQGNTVNLGNADTVLKKGLYEWNKISIFYQNSNKTFYIYINGVYKKSLTVTTDYFADILTQNYLGKSAYSDPYLEGSYREFKVYKNLTYNYFIDNLKYNIIPNKPDNSLYCYLPLSNNENNYTFWGKKKILNNTFLLNKALDYNKDASKDTSFIYTANNNAYYYGDSLNEFVTGEFGDTSSNLQFLYNQGISKDTILPIVGRLNYLWQLNLKNFYGNFTVYNKTDNNIAETINVILAPNSFLYTKNNQYYPIREGQSVLPTIKGSENIVFSIANNAPEGISINANTGVINWTNQLSVGKYTVPVYATNIAGVDSFTYIFNLQDTLQGLNYSPDTVQVPASNFDSLSFLPSLVKGTGATFRILNPTTGFGINTSNGRINWLNTVPIGVYTLRVQANNAFNIPVTANITISFANLPPSNLKYLKDTMSFNQFDYSSTPRPSIVTGGLPVRYNIQSISPNTNSISIDTITGAIKWVKGVVGNYTITVRASNALGSVVKTVNIILNSPNNTLVGYTNGGLYVGQFSNFTSIQNMIELPKLDFRNSDYTIESWAKVLTYNTATLWRRIFEFGSGKNSLGLVLGFQTFNKLGMHSNTNTDIIMNYPVGYDPYNWNHYAITVSDSLRLYINGVLIRTAEGNRPNVVYDKNYLNVSNWLGDVAGLNAYKEFRIWKFARNAEDIANNYQSNIANNTLGLYYYLPLTINNILPNEKVRIPNLVLAPEYNSIYTLGYRTSLPNAAINSDLKDSSKIVTNFISNEISSYYYTDSTQQRIYGNYAGVLSAGEQLQYSIDTGRNWKPIINSQNNVFSQYIDSNFKYGLIKIRSVINNVVTNRVFNDINVTIFPKVPTIGTATANNNGTINLTFTPNAISGGSSYKIYTATGQLVATTTQSPVLISGLNNGQAYQFKVSAVSELGESNASELSNVVYSINTTLQITTFTNNILGVNVTPTSTIPQYTNFRVTYQINPGFIFDSLIIDNVKITDSVLGGYTFLNVNKIHSVKIYVSRIKFTISISKNEGGVVNSNQSIIPVYYGDTTIIQIIPNSRYKIDSVFINEVYQTNTASSFAINNIQQNYRVRVVFKAKVYNTILIEVLGNGNVDTVGLVEIETGTNYTLRYSPKIGNRLDSVIVNDVLVNDSTQRYTFTNLQSNVKIRLVFKLKTFTITAIAKNGTITPSGINTYNYGTQINYNFAPISKSYVLDSLLIDGELQVNPDTATYTFTNLDTNHIIQAVFNLQSAIKYAIIITKSEGVTVTPSSTQQVGYGGSLRVTWVGNTGYILDSLFVNGKYNRDSINGYTFTNVRSVQSIYIKYKIKTFTITSSAGLRGSISPLGISVVNYGSNKTYILLPDIGYEVDSLLINGANVAKPSDNIYTFNNVTENKTIFVTFKVNLNPCGGTKPTPNIVRVGDALKSDITTFAKQRWYLAGILKDSTPNNTYTPTESGVYTLIGVDVLGCESNISKKYYYAKSCILPAGRLGNGAYIQASVIDNSSLILVKWCTELVQENVAIKILNLEGEVIYEQKVAASTGMYILNKAQIKAKNYVIEVVDSKGEVLQISDVVN